VNSKNNYSEFNGKHRLGYTRTILLMWFPGSPVYGLVHKINTHEPDISNREKAKNIFVKGKTLATNRKFVNILRTLLTNL